MSILSSHKKIFFSSLSFAGTFLCRFLSDFGFWMVFLWQLWDEIGVGWGVFKVREATMASHNWKVDLIESWSRNQLRGSVTKSLFEGRSVLWMVYCVNINACSYFYYDKSFKIYFYHVESLCKDNQFAANTLWENGEKLQVFPWIINDGKIEKWRGNLE